MARSALDLVGASNERQRRNPLDYVRLTPPQIGFVSATEPEVLWRDGNQLGKSFALAYDLHHTCRGTHPYRPARRRPPIKAQIISTGYDQMAPLMEKIWDLAPKDEIDPENGFEPGRGITGKPPRIVYTSGPGAGSVITFATYGAGSGRVAGGTLDYVGCDEPPTESVYGEVLPRVMRRKGLVRVTMTPVPDMPDQTWLKEKVAAHGVRELNYGLTEAHLWPEGYPRPWLTQEEIDAYADGLLEHEVMMRIKGAWIALTRGRWLKHFEDTNIVAFLLRELKGWRLTVGMDHGTPGGREGAVLIGSRWGDTPRPQVAVIDESINEGFTKPEDDAASVIAMLERHGLSYFDIDDWVGDVPTESKLYGIQKSNAEIRKELARQLGLPISKTKYIHTPFKFRYSLTQGMRLLNTLCSRRDRERPDLIVHPRCEGFVESCRNFKGDPKDPLKDILDAGRYAIERACTGQVVPVLQAAY